MFPSISISSSAAKSSKEKDSTISRSKKASSFIEFASSLAFVETTHQGNNNNFARNSKSGDNNNNNNNNVSLTSDEGSIAVVLTRKQDVALCSRWSDIPNWLLDCHSQQQTRQHKDTSGKRADKKAGRQQVQVEEEQREDFRFCLGCRVDSRAMPEVIRKALCLPTTTTTTTQSKPTDSTAKKKSNKSSTSDKQSQQQQQQPNQEHDEAVLNRVPVLWLPVEERIQNRNKSNSDNNTVDTAEESDGEDEHISSLIEETLLASGIQQGVVIVQQPVDAATKRRIEKRLRMTTPPTTSMISYRFIELPPEPATNTAANTSTKPQQNEQQRQHEGANIFEPLAYHPQQKPAQQKQQQTQQRVALIPSNRRAIFVDVAFFVNHLINNPTLLTLFFDQQKNNFVVILICPIPSEFEIVLQLVRTEIRQRILLPKSSTAKQLPLAHSRDDDDGDDDDDDGDDKKISIFAKRSAYIGGGGRPAASAAAAVSKPTAKPSSTVTTTAKSSNFSVHATMTNAKDLEVTTKSLIQQAKLYFNLDLQKCFAVTSSSGSCAPIRTAFQHMGFYSSLPSVTEQKVTKNILVAATSSKNNNNSQSVINNRSAPKSNHFRFGFFSTAHNSNKISRGGDNNNNPNNNNNNNNPPTTLLSLIKSLQEHVEAWLIRTQDVEFATIRRDSLGSSRPLGVIQKMETLSLSSSASPSHCGAPSASATLSPSSSSFSALIQCTALFGTSIPVCSHDAVGVEGGRGRVTGAAYQIALERTSGFSATVVEQGRQMYRHYLAQKQQYLTTEIVDFDDDDEEKEPSESVGGDLRKEVDLALLQRRRKSEEKRQLFQVQVTILSPSTAAVRWPNQSFSVWLKFSTGCGGGSDEAGSLLRWRCSHCGVKEAKRKPSLQFLLDDIDDDVDDVDENDRKNNEGGGNDDDDEDDELKGEDTQSNTSTLRSSTTRRTRTRTRTRTRQQRQQRQQQAGEKSLGPTEINANCNWLGGSSDDDDPAHAQDTCSKTCRVVVASWFLLRDYLREKLKRPNLWSSSRDDAVLQYPTTPSISSPCLSSYSSSSSFVLLSKMIPLWFLASCRQLTSDFFLSASYSVASSRFRDDNHPQPEQLGDQGTRTSNKHRKKKSAIAAVPTPTSLAPSPSSSPRLPPPALALCQDFCDLLHGRAEGAEEPSVTSKSVSFIQQYDSSLFLRTSPSNIVATTSMLLSRLTFATLRHQLHSSSFSQDRRRKRESDEQRQEEDEGDVGVDGDGKNKQTERDQNLPGEITESFLCKVCGVETKWSNYSIEGGASACPFFLHPRNVVLKTDCKNNNIHIGENILHSSSSASSSSTSSSSSSPAFYGYNGLFNLDCGCPTYNSSVTNTSFSSSFPPPPVFVSLVLSSSQTPQEEDIVRANKNIKSNSISSSNKNPYFVTIINEISYRLTGFIKQNVKQGRYQCLSLIREGKDGDKDDLGGSEKQNDSNLSPVVDEFDLSQPNFEQPTKNDSSTRWECLEVYCPSESCEQKVVTFGSESQVWQLALRKTFLSPQTQQSAQEAAKNERQEEQRGEEADEEVVVLLRFEKLVCASDALVDFVELKVLEEEQKKHIRH